jgi:hypothetical protein
VFVALILLSGFAFYAVTQDVTQHYSSTMSSMNDLDWNRNQENIVIKQITIASTNQLNVTAENDGSIQSHLIWLGIFNKTAIPENQTYQALNEFVGPGEIDNIVSNSTVKGGNQYVIQLVTELGNTVESKFYPANYASCALTLVTTPPTVYQGNNVTVLFTVTLNDTVVNSVQSLTAALNATPTQLVQLVGNSPLSVSGLTRGTSAFFWWTYNATSTGTVTFNATYLQAPTGIYALSTAEIVSPPQQGGQGSVTINGVNCTASQNPSQWNLLGSTQNISGSISSLASNDTNYASFSSYYIGGNHFVDNNTSNVDNLTSIGAESNFTAQQAGPDNVNDTLTEANTVSIEPEAYVYMVANQNLGNWANPTNAYDSNTATYAEKSVTGIGWTGYLVLNCSDTVRGTKIHYWFSRSSVFTTFTINIGNQTGAWVQVYNATPPFGSYQNVTFPFSQYTAIEIQAYKPSGTGTQYARINEVQAVNASWTPPANYKLDIEEQWTSVDNTTTNQQLCIFTGTWTSTEALEVDGWNTTSSTWVVLNSSLVSNAWNNITLPAGLLTATFTIRFIDGTRIGDTVQDTWSIDATLLYLWPSKCKAQVEFTGFADLQNWTQLVWLVDSSWNTSAVNVTVQLYNYVLGNYSSSGDGYVFYISNSTNTDYCVNQTITSNPVNFRDSTGYWKVEITGVASTQFQMNVNWIELRDSYAYVDDSIPYNALVWYTIQATTAGGSPAPFTYASLYANGTTVTFQDAANGTSIPSQAWVLLDANGKFQLQIRSMTNSGETFVLYVAVGTAVQQKTITQAAQQ